ncbi:MAG TPA: MarR family transcriptional regulator [Mycobacteriales bacterium]|nr:MarR family transcriptional regulator [Mycobacteriales bacterium]
MTSKAAEARRAWRALSRLFLSDETHDRFHDACEAVGLPHPGSLKALLSIDVDAAAPMRTLAEHLRCDASYVTALVDALEDSGYVARRASDTDRRVKLVELTGEGRKAKERALDVLLAPPPSLEQLTATELRTLAQLLERVGGAYPPLPS